jgi:hypothetical protein
MQLTEKEARSGASGDIWLANNIICVSPERLLPELVLDNTSHGAGEVFSTAAVCLASPTASFAPPFATKNSMPGSVEGDTAGSV